MKKRQKEFLIYVIPLNDELGRYCFALTGSIEDASDLIQDVLLIAWENFENIKYKNSFKYYLFKIASNRYKNQLRKKKFSAEWKENEIGLMSDNSLSPEMQTDISLMFKVIHNLPDLYRDLVLLFEICGFKIKEIAMISGLKEDNIKKRLSRARKKIQKQLGINYSYSSNGQSYIDQKYNLNKK